MQNVASLELFGHLPRGQRMLASLFRHAPGKLDEMLESAMDERDWKGVCALSMSLNLRPRRLTHASSLTAPMCE